MKITTWNVNGLRAALSKNAFDYIKPHNADIVCLQEIKTRPEQINHDQIESLGNYQVIWNPAKRPGYSGVASLYKIPPKSYEIGLRNAVFDDEGRVIQMQFDNFRLFNIYFPNGQRDLERLKYKLDFYENLLVFLDQIHNQGENIIICGDFNTAHKEIDLRNPKENETTSGFLPEERAMLDKYLQHGFIDVYRYLYPDRVQYTWWTYRFNARLRDIGWRLDYFLVSESIISRVKDVVIHEEILGSDHCPVTMVLE
ncbi:MAG: exodeoxyribonuclease III [Chloroflexi bacterium]|nr:exodeoxyribonuclease III [Chloroflexota bacterium]